MFKKNRHRFTSFSVYIPMACVAIAIAMLTLGISFYLYRGNRTYDQSTFAAIEFAPDVGELELNRERLIRLIIKAHKQGARYIVLPELSLVRGLNVDGELLRDPGQVMSEPIPGPTTDFFGKYAKALGIWLVFSMLESESKTGGYFVTTVLLNERGEIIATYRKILTRFNNQDGKANRGDYRAMIDTTADGNRRLGIISGDDIQVGVPRLADRGADTILITAGWTDHDPTNWYELSRQLSKQYAVNLVVANRRSTQNHSGTQTLTGVYTWDGGTIVSEAKTDALVVVSPPAREQRWVIESALGVPLSVPVPSYAPATLNIAELGRKLFFDKKLSSTGTVSCSNCHDPERAFTNGKTTGEGVFGRKTRRNVPSLLNVAFRPLLRWDGYASTLENFAKYPVSGFNEMDFHYLDKATPYIQTHPEYVETFQTAMGVKNIEFDHVAKALATYQRTLISGNSAFDRYYYRGETSALSESAKRGFALFIGKAECSKCHLIGDHYALFMDFKYHFLGVGYYSEPGQSNDIGLGAISTDELSGFFQTPSLRNVAETGPYMHDGSIASLEEVIEFFDRGGVSNSDRHPELKPLLLSSEEKRDLREFLHSLTGDQKYNSQGQRLSSRPGEARDSEQTWRLSQSPTHPLFPESPFRSIR